MVALAASLAFLFVAAYCRSRGWVLALSAFLGAAAGSMAPDSFTPWVFASIAAACALALFKPARLIWTRPLFKRFQAAGPELGAAESAALEAETVWWDAELLSGDPDFSKLLGYPDAQLCQEEMDFLAGPVERLCQSLGVRRGAAGCGLSPENLRAIKESGFWGLSIQKKYGGFEFSAAALAGIAAKLGARCGALAVAAVWPNVLGLAPLLQRYGSRAQKAHWLPLLAQGSETACFALDSPYVTADPGAIGDWATVCLGDGTDPVTGRPQKGVLGLRLSWDKAGVAMAPIASLLGLAVKVRDPDGLLGGPVEPGAACVMIPLSAPGVKVGREPTGRDQAFPIGPVSGKDVFVSLDWVVGGRGRIGGGLRMLADCMTVARCVGSPSLGVAACAQAACACSLFSDLGERLGEPLWACEGVAQSLARVGVSAYQAIASQDLALAGLDLGERPGLVGAMLARSSFTQARRAAMEARAILGAAGEGAGARALSDWSDPVCRLASWVEAADGSRLLARSLPIFELGAERSNRRRLKEREAAARGDLNAFDALAARHARWLFVAAARSFGLGLGNGALSGVGGPKATLTRRRKLTRLSAAVALFSDALMLRGGGALKFEKGVSARLGDAMSSLYVAGACIKRFESHGCRANEADLAVCAIDSSLHEAAEALAGMVRNLRSRPRAWAAGLCVAPLGWRMPPPSDRRMRLAAMGMVENGALLRSLTQRADLPDDPSNPWGALKAARRAVLETRGLEKKLRAWAASGELRGQEMGDLMREALRLGKIGREDFERLSAARAMRRAVLKPDAFPGSPLEAL